MERMHAHKIDRLKVSERFVRMVELFGRKDREWVVACCVEVVGNIDAELN